MTRRRRVTLLTVLGALALVVGLLAAFRPDRRTDAEKVQALLDECSAATEVESVTRIMRLLADDYSDDLGASAVSLRTQLRQAFVGPTEWRVSWAIKEMRPLDEESFEAVLAMRVRQLSSGGTVALDRTADLHVTFVRQGREVKAQRVLGLRALAERVEGEYFGY